MPKDGIPAPGYTLSLSVTDARYDIFANKVSAIEI